MQIPTILLLLLLSSIVVQRRLRDAVNIADLRMCAKKRAHKMVFDYLDSGADDEIILRRAKDAYSELEMHYHCLAGLKPPLDLSTRIFGYVNAHACTCTRDILCGIQTRTRPPLLTTHILYMCTQLEQPRCKSSVFCMSDGWQPHVSQRGRSCSRESCGTSWNYVWPFVPCHHRNSADRKHVSSNMLMEK